MKCDQTSLFQMSINLGYMQISDGVWSKGYCYCEKADDGIDDEIVICSPCESKLDPDQIVIPKQDVTIYYDYPLHHIFTKVHHTDNSAGFTRREISEQIMKTYAQIYADEDSDMGKPTEHIPGMLNRDTSEGRYRIWGHDIGDLILYSMSPDKEKENVFWLNIDS